MAGFIRRKKIPSLEELSINTSDIYIRKTRIYGYCSRTRKPFVLGNGMDLGSSPVYKPKNKSGPKSGCKIRRVTESVRVEQVKPKSPTRPRGRPKNVKKTPLSKLEKPGRKSKVYEPSQEEIRQVANVIAELNRGRVKATMDTRKEEY